MTEPLGDPTRCYASGCARENEILMHLSDNPAAFSDLCWEHAHEAFRATPLTWTCDCAFCRRSRKLLGGPPAADDASDAGDGRDGVNHVHAADVLLCPTCQRGEWIVETETGSQYLLDTRHPSVATVIRLPDASCGADPSLRRDGDPIRVIDSSQVRQGANWCLILDLRRDGLLTQRTTSPVRSVRPLARPPSG